MADKLNKLIDEKGNHIIQTEFSDELFDQINKKHAKYKKKLKPSINDMQIAYGEDVWLNQ